MVDRVKTEKSKAAWEGQENLLTSPLVYSKSLWSTSVVSHCVTFSSHLSLSPSIMAAAAGCGEGRGADLVSQTLGKHEIKGPSRR